MYILKTYVFFFFFGLRNLKLMYFECTNCVYYRNCVCVYVCFFFTKRNYVCWMYIILQNRKNCVLRIYKILFILKNYVHLIVYIPWKFVCIWFRELCSFLKMVYVIYVEMCTFLKIVYVQCTKLGAEFCTSLKIMYVKCIESCMFLGKLWHSIFIIVDVQSKNLCTLNL